MYYAIVVNRGRFFTQNLALTISSHDKIADNIYSQLIKGKNGKRFNKRTFTKNTSAVCTPDDTREPVAADL